MRLEESAGLCAARKQVALSVSERIARPKLSDVSWMAFLETIELEESLQTFQIAMLATYSEEVFEVAQIEKLLLLYERGQKLSEFLLLGYRNASQNFKIKLSPAGLMAAAALLGAKKEMIFYEMAAGGCRGFIPEHLDVVQDLILYVRGALLGEEDGCYFIAECEGALRHMLSGPEY